MCYDRSPAVFLQRYNFPSEQAWRQVPRLALLPLFPRETLPSPISPLLHIRRNRLSLHRLSPYPPLRMGFRRGKIDHGEMAEWSIAAVLKTVELRGSGGSNPSLSAEKKGCKSQAICTLLLYTYYSLCLSRTRVISSHTLVNKLLFTSI